MNKDNPIKVEWQATKPPEPEPVDEPVYKNGAYRQSTFSIPRKAFAGMNAIQRPAPFPQQAPFQQPMQNYNMNVRVGGG